MLHHFSGVAGNYISDVKKGAKLIELRETNIEELAEIFELGNQAHTKPFLTTKSMADYKREFTDENTNYLCIVNATNNIIGYVILLKDQNKNAIQLKRILISKEHLGIGQCALTQLEKYCRSIMGIDAYLARCLR